MKAYILNELGNLTTNEAEKIVDLTDGGTYMNFKVGYSNIAGNCTIIISTDYELEEKEIRSFYIGYMTRCLLGNIHSQSEIGGCTC